MPCGHLEIRQHHPEFGRVRFKRARQSGEREVGVVMDRRQGLLHRHHGTRNGIRRGRHLRYDDRLHGFRSTVGSRFLRQFRGEFGQL